MILLLEVARGLAALWVFFFHVRDMFINSSPIIFDISSYGAFGVPMFFVISGYVITYSAESSLKKAKSPFIFLKNRFRRIYPTFWASVIIILMLPYTIEAISFIKTGIYSLPEGLISKLTLVEWSNLLLLSKVFWATSHDLQSQFNTINSVYWTIAIEFQFYVVVFIALAFGKNYKIIITGVSIISLIALLIPNNINYGLFIHYWPSFSIGILLAYLHRNNLFFKLKFKQSVLLIVVCSISTILLLQTNFFETKTHFVFSVYFGMFLWMIAHFEKLLVNLKNSKNKLIYWTLEPWLILGTMSYSVYLLHSKLYQIPQMFLRQIIDSNNILSGLLTILFTLIVCFPLYYYIERKFLSTNYKIIHSKVMK